MTLNVITNGAEAPAPAAGDAPPGSILAQLRERAASERRNRTLEVPVGTDRWGDMLSVRYRMPAMEEADRLLSAMARFANDAAGMGKAGLELMASCCLTVLAHADGRTEDLETRITGHLLELLGLPFPPGVTNPNEVTTQEVVETLFDQNWVAINLHAGQIVNWLQEGVGGLGETKRGS